MQVKQPITTESRINGKKEKSR